MTVDTKALEYLDCEGRYIPGVSSHSSQSDDLLNSDVILLSPKVSRKRQLEAIDEDPEIFRSPLPTQYPVELSPPSLKRSLGNSKNKYLLGQPLFCPSPNKSVSTMKDHSLHFQMRRNNFRQNMSRVDETGDHLDLNKVFSKKSSFSLKPRFQRNNFQSEERIRVPYHEHIPELPSLFSDLNIERLKSLQSPGQSHPTRLADVIPTKSGFPKRAPSA